MSERRASLKQRRSVSLSDESSSRLSSRRRTREQTTSGSSERETDAMSTDDDENAVKFVQVTQHLSDDKRRVKGIVADKFKDELVNRVTWIHQNSGGLWFRCLKCKAYGHSADNCQDKPGLRMERLHCQAFIRSTNRSTICLEFCTLQLECPSQGTIPTRRLMSPLGLCSQEL